MPASRPGEEGLKPAGRSNPRAVLNLLGLAARAGCIVAGTDAVRRAARVGEVRWVGLAANSSPGQQQKLVPLLSARQVPHHIRFTREELGAAIGRAPVSAVGVSDLNFARRVVELLAALPSSQD